MNRRSSSSSRSCAVPWRRSSLPSDLSERLETTLADADRAGRRRARVVGAGRHARPAQLGAGRWPPPWSAPRPPRLVLLRAQQRAKRRRPDSALDAAEKSPARRVRRGAQAARTLIRARSPRVVSHCDGTRRDPARARRRGADAARAAGRGARLRGALRPPRQRGLLARLPDVRVAGGRRGRRPGGVPRHVAQRRALRPHPRQRPDVGPRDRPQPRDRLAAPQHGPRPQAGQRRGDRGALRGPRAHRGRGGAARRGRARCAASSTSCPRSRAA